MKKGIKQILPAFKYKNFRLYFIAQVVSLSGSWMQGVAQAWLVYELTRSPFWVGVIAALNLLPITFFGLFGGAIVDRLPRKKLYFWTQSLLMTQALLLSLLTFTGLINLPVIALMALTMGIINTVDQPLRMALVPELVEKEALSSAIALNAGIFNTARVTGPAAAGLVISTVGSAGAFFINALTFLAPIIAFSKINIPSSVQKHHPHPIKFILQGIRYALDHELIKTVLIYVAITALFGWSYMAIMPVVADQIFHKGATGLGLLNAAVGIGAVLGAIIVSATAKKIKREFRVLAGTLAFCSGLFLFSLTENFTFGLIFLGLSGLGLVLQNTTLNSIVQHNVESFIRGRIMSIYLTMFLGMTPIGNFLIGFISEYFSSQIALRVGTIIVLIFGLWTFFKLKSLRTILK